MKENYVKSDYAQTWLENEIVVQDIDPKVTEVNLEMAMQFVLDRKAASGSAERMVRVLVIVNNAININQEAKKYYELEDSYINIKAIAMVMDNYIASFVANLVFKIKKNRVPMEVFNNREKALKWLEKYK
jgi:hypothetical protein